VRIVRAEKGYTITNLSKKDWLTIGIKAGWIQDAGIVERVLQRFPEKIPPFIDSAIQWIDKFENLLNKKLPSISNYVSTQEYGGFVEITFPQGRGISTKRIDPQKVTPEKALIEMEKSI